MSSINIRIDDSFAYVTYEKGHVSYSKTLSVDTLVTALASQHGVRLPGVMPPGTRYYVNKGGQHFIYLEIPPIPRMIKYTNRSDKVVFEGIVPMPWGVLEMIVRDGDSGNYVPVGGRIFAMKRPLLSDKEDLYHFPAANVHNSHSICWGNTFSQVPRLTCLAEFGRFVDYYFSSDFNSDIHPRLNRYGRYEDMLREIKDQKVFPLDILVPANTTFESLTRNI